MNVNIFLAYKRLVMCRKRLCRFRPIYTYSPLKQFKRMFLSISDYDEWCKTVNCGWSVSCTTMVKVRKVKLSLCLTNYALRQEDVWGSGCINPHLLDLGTSWRWVVSFTPRPLYPREKAPVPIGWEAAWAPKQVWKTWRRENSWHYRDSNSDLSVVQPVASRYTHYAIMVAPENKVFGKRWSTSLALIVLRKLHKAQSSQKQFVSHCGYVAQHDYRIVRAYGQQENRYCSIIWINLLRGN
jgi:hypothetical protein